eukprot:NODE_9047_length_333_cov_96.137324_g7286_i0.p1 GENE.NODE_9047_length_333_cov_96.137324_g7286_i0~~NODE_9047_length_333_cov_96.137324_g7286_i0.p1  ORF type:complete len:61 (-),score=2.55 NODE_9047_length_333_cov_96.137324_g7286_i0:149-310(-)
MGPKAASLLAHSYVQTQSHPDRTAYICTDLHAHICIFFIHADMRPYMHPVIEG